MTIQEFIECCIEGGYKFPRKSVFTLNNGDVIAVESFILNPKAWEAVAKVKDWRNDEGECGACEYPNSMEGPEVYMYRMIKALCNGSTLEEYIATL